MMKVLQKRFKNQNSSREMTEDGVNECDLGCLQELSIKNLADSFNYINMYGNVVSV